MLHNFEELDRDILLFRLKVMILKDLDGTIGELQSSKSKEGQIEICQ